MDQNQAMPDSAPSRVAYCPECGAPMVTRRVSDKLRRVCSACEYIHFTDPKVAVGVLIVHDGKILLVRRAMMPERGKWSIPAGFLDHGEDPKITAEREVLEETNLRVRIGELVDVYHNANALTQGGASILILYRAEILGGALEAGDDADDVGFFRPDALPQLAFASTRDAIGRWQNGDFAR